MISEVFGMSGENEWRMIFHVYTKYSHLSILEVLRWLWLSVLLSIWPNHTSPHALINTLKLRFKQQERICWESRHMPHPGDMLPNFDRASNSQSPCCIQEPITWVMAFINVPQRRLITCVWQHKHQVLMFKSLLMWGQTDHLLYSRTLFLSICSGLDPDDTNPVFSPLLVTYTRAHTHTRVSLATGRAFVSEKNRRLTCCTVTDTRDMHPHHTRTDNLSILVQPRRPALPSSAALTHAEDAEDAEERVRDNQTTWQTPAYTKMWGGGTNKQTFLMK